MSQSLQVLIVEDFEEDALLLLGELRRGGYSPLHERVCTRQAFTEALARTWDVILSDYAMPSFTGLDALHELNRSGLDIPFLTVSGQIGEETAVELMKAGARDFIPKDRLIRLVPAVERELAEAAERRRRREAEAALRESERRYRQVFEHTSDCLVLHEATRDGRFRLLALNPACERLAGLCATEAVGKPAEEVLPSLGDYLVSTLRECVEAGEAIHREEELDLPAGRRSFSTTIVPVRDDAGSIYRLLTVASDVTERKQAEEQLRLLNLALAQVRDSAYLVDENARILYVNEEACRSLGYEREELLALTVRDIAPQPVWQDWPAHWREVEARGAVALESTHRAKDGRVFPVELTVTHFLFEGRNYHLALARDISERKQAEAALRAKQKQLAALTAELSLAEERERRQIAAELHDQIGQTLLLARIKLSVLAKGGGGVPEPVGDEAGRVLELLDGAIRDIRSLTVQLTPPLLDGPGLPAAFEWLGRRLEADYGLRVTLESDGSGGELDSELRSVVYRAVRELLINVARHAGTKEARVVLEGAVEELRIRVEDQGVGFEPGPDVLGSPAPDGGFGLFSVQQRVERLGGAMELWSHPGQGTRVTLRVPRHE